MGDGQLRRIVAGLVGRLPELTTAAAQPPAEKSTDPAPATQPGAGVPRLPWWRRWLGR